MHGTTTNRSARTNRNWSSSGSASESPCIITPCMEFRRGMSIAGGRHNYPSLRFGTSAPLFSTSANIEEVGMRTSAISRCRRSGGCETSMASGNRYILKQPSELHSSLLEKYSISRRHRHCSSFQTAKFPHNPLTIARALDPSMVVLFRALKLELVAL